MKETYRVPRPPEIARNGNLVESRNSKELLSVLGFCAPEASAAQEPRQGESRDLHAIKTRCTGSDGVDKVCRSDISFHTGTEELELVVGAD